jgi:hypothetical protein
MDIFLDRFYEAALKCFRTSLVSAASYFEFVCTQTGRGILKWNYPAIHNPIKAEAIPELRHQPLRVTYQFCCSRVYPGYMFNQQQISRAVH